MVFPQMHADPAGGSPTSLERTRTQLVDALAAAAMASGEDDTALRLAQSPRACLHKLGDDSMLRKAWREAGDSTACTTVGRASDSEVVDGDDEATSTQFGSQITSNASGLAAWADAQPEEHAVLAMSATAALRQPQAGGHAGRHGGQAAEEGSALEEMVEEMELDAGHVCRGIEAAPPASQQQQRASPEGSDWQTFCSAFAVQEAAGSFRRGMHGLQQPAATLVQDTRQQASSAPARTGQRDLGEGSRTPLNARRRSLQVATGPRASSNSRQQLGSLPDRGLSPPSPPGSTISSGGRRLKAKSLSTLRSMFAGPADFLAAASPPLTPEGCEEGIQEAAAPRLPPRIPPPRPSKEQPVVINIFRVGCGLHALCEPTVIPRGAHAHAA